MAYRALIRQFGTVAELFLLLQIEEHHVLEDIVADSTHSIPQQKEYKNTETNYN